MAITVVIAPGSYKGSLLPAEAAAAMARGVRRALPDARVILAPMADGGEGTVQALVDATGGSLQRLTVTGPLGQPVPAFFGISPDGQTAFIEMAAASGLPLVPPGKLSPQTATTFGTGELMRAALDAGCRRLIVGLGGSATNDGGAGALQALGLRILDAGGNALGFGGGQLGRAARLDPFALDPRLQHAEIIVACDVDNPLCGPQGASAVFGPQKGASPELVRQLDAALAHWGDLLRRDLGRDVAEIPGAGAAGGLGAGLLALGARLSPGVELVMAAGGFVDKLAGADLVLTGEGRIDSQTAHGKTPVGVARAAKAQGLPVVAIAGGLGPGYAGVYAAGIDACLSLVSGPMSLEQAMAEGDALLAAAAEAAVRIFALGRHRA